MIVDNKSFVLNDNLAHSSSYLTELSLCQLRLKHDSEVDWFLMIPMRSNIIEWTDFTREEQTLFINDLNQVTTKIKEHTQFKKINLASLGNIVEQMHWHLILRQESDRAWPHPLWTYPDPSPLNFLMSKVEFWKKIFNSH